MPHHTTATQQHSKQQIETRTHAWAYLCSLFITYIYTQRYVIRYGVTSMPGSPVCQGMYAWYAVVGPSVGNLLELYFFYYPRTCA
jgi:hypothetical protein